MGNKKQVITGVEADATGKTETGDHERIRNTVIRLSTFIVFVLSAIAIFIYAGRSQAKLNEQFQKSELPAGMPSIAPIPKSIVKIDPSKNKIEDYTYSMGDEAGEMKTGKMYTIEGVSDNTPTEIRDFYNQLLLDQGYRQRINISLPSGHRLDLENEKNIFSLEVERKKNATETTVKIVIYD